MKRVSEFPSKTTEDTIICKLCSKEHTYTKTARMPKRLFCSHKCNVTFQQRKYRAEEKGRKSRRLNPPQNSPLNAVKFIGMDSHGEFLLA